MRIIAVAHSHQLGGIERHVIDLLLTLREHGHTVCFAGPLDGWLGDQCAHHDLERLHLPMHGMYDPWSALRLARFARRWRADVLHGHAQRGARYASWAGRWSGTAAVATAHSTNALRRFEHVQRIICVSDAVRSALAARGYVEQRLVRIYSGVPDPAPGAPDRATARARLQIDDQRFVIGMVARLVPVKGHEVAIAALSRLGRRDVLLLLAGADDTAQAAAIRRQAEAAGVASRVRFLGERRDIPAVLAACDLIAAPSHREALSLSLLEAAAMHVPAVASRVGGIPEAVEDGVTGLLFEDGDHLAMAAAIARLADDRALRRRMADAARARYLDLFEPQRMLAALEPLYAECMRARRSGTADGGKPGDVASAR